MERSAGRSTVANVVGNLERGRAGFERRAWADAYESLSLAERANPLPPEDLERMAIAAYLVGRDGDSESALDRAHHEYRGRGDDVSAARCAFWLGMSLLLRGETARASGWLGRARRLVEDRDCVERGYLLLPAAEQQLTSGNGEAAYATASEAASQGEQFGDADLVACARHLQGRALLIRGEVQPGLALLDEAMVAVTAGELSPMITGLIYCSVLEACQQSFALGRAREWTSAMAKWCEEQPELIAFTTSCLVHRAEILRLHGAWPDAIEEAQRACERFSRGGQRKPPAAAFYQTGEVHRLRGELAAAEEAYRRASREGLDPQPGLSLLRLAQGRVDAARASIGPVLGATSARAPRMKLLAAYVEILLAAGDVVQAHAACHELEEMAGAFDSEALSATAAQARGSVELAEGDPQAALASLRRAQELWQALEVPFEAARARVLLGLAGRALGDEDGTRLEWEAARFVFETLGAAPDLARTEALLHREPPAERARTHGLTRRELEVLRLVATGKTNKTIAKELYVSEKTVDRHVSNIFNKLDVGSRAAATAYAYEHGLI